MIVRYGLHLWCAVGRWWQGTAGGVQRIGDRGPPHGWRISAALQRGQGWFVIDFCGLVPRKHAEDGRHLRYLSVVELSFEICFDGPKRCGYLVVGTNVRF